MTETLTLCRRALCGKEELLTTFLEDYGYLVKHVVKDGVVFHDGTHYIFSSNTACSGCEACKP